MNFEKNAHHLESTDKSININIDQSTDQLSQLNPTELNQIDYTLKSPIHLEKLSNPSTDFNRKTKKNHRFHNKDWSSDIDFRSALSGAEIRNLDLLQLLNDQSVRDWLAETIYPDHVSCIVYLIFF